VTVAYTSTRSTPDVNCGDADRISWLYKQIRKIETKTRA